MQFLVTALSSDRKHISPTLTWQYAAIKSMMLQKQNRDIIACPQIPSELQVGSLERPFVRASRVQGFFPRCVLCHSKWKTTP